MNPKASAAPIQFSGSDSYTLTTSSVASDDVVVDFAKKITIFPYYKAGSAETANTATFTIEINPKDSSSDPTGAFWSPIGQYTDSSGTWTEELVTGSVFTVTQQSTSIYAPGIPIDFENLNASRLRIKIKENGVSANAGSVKFIVVKNSFIQ